MIDVKFQLIGIKEFARKSDGKAMSIAVCVADCTPDDNRYGNYGKKVVELFLPDDKVGTLSTEHLGQKFVPSYAINSYGKPSLVDYAIEPLK